MTAYVVMIRNKTHDPEGMEKYASLARQAPIEKLSLVAAKTNRFEVLEGPPAEAVAILSFPTMEDALEWYNSEEYRKAREVRAAAGDFRAVLVEGLN